ncbi:MAG TPA: serine hydrolase domain-containing protein [Thermoanaerobaculia bacterium]|nr:serine hydrolase domain-containing protein [Thermoanaerobaculia bacterium]
MKGTPPPSRGRTFVLIGKITLQAVSRVVPALGLAFALLAAGAAGCRGARSAAGAGPVGEGAGRPRGQVHGQLGAALDDYMSRLEAYGYSGSLLVAKGGQAVIDKGYGLADRSRGIPYTADTIFDIASISKQFTAAAILKLEMQGKLRVEDPLAKYLPAVPPDKEGITLHTLLTHTSGLRDTFGDEYERVSREELVRRALAAPLLWRPGKRHFYSSAGYGLLAAVVETVSGVSLETYLRDNLFRPAGMRHTGYRLPAADLPLVAHGYSALGDWGTPLDHPWLPDGPYWNLRGNGGILSTAGDLYRWHLALAANSVLSAQANQKFVEPYVSEGRQAHARYAYGWSIADAPGGGRSISHVGGNGIFESDFRRYVDAGVVIVMSSNSTDFFALTVSPHVENRVFGLPDPEPPATPGGDPARAGRCAGNYEMPAGDQVRVSAAPGGGGGLDIAPLAPGAFALLRGAADAEELTLIGGWEAQVAALLSGARRGDYAPLAKAMGSTPETAAPKLAGWIRAQLASLGPWQDFELLGTAAHGGRAATYARFTFSRGAKIAELAWSGSTIETLRWLDSPPAVLFLPTPEHDFAAFDIRTGAIVRVACDSSGTLLFHAGKGEVRAKRVE